VKKWISRTRWVWSPQCPDACPRRLALLACSRIEDIPSEVEGCKEGKKKLQLIDKRKWGSRRKKKGVIYSNSIYCINFTKSKGRISTPYTVSCNHQSPQIQSENASAKARERRRSNMYGVRADGLVSPERGILTERVNQTMCLCD